MQLSNKKLNKSIFELLQTIKKYSKDLSNCCKNIVETD